MKKLVRPSVLFFLALCALTIFKISVQDFPRITSCILKQNDIQPLFLSSRVWLSGQNPYDPAILTREMSAANPAGLALLHGVCEEDCKVYYPPSALPIFAVFSLVPWPVFLFVYMAASIGLYLFLLHKLASMLPGLDEKLIFWGVGLAFSPFHAGIGSCNISELLISVILLSVFAADGILPAIVIALVACIKPPLALLFLVSFFISGRKRSGVLAFATVAAIALISFARLRHIAWLPSYTQAISDFSAIADSPKGVAHHGMPNTGFLNLQAPFYLLTGSPHIAVLLDYAVLAILFIALAITSLCRNAVSWTFENRLLVTAAVCSLTLFQSTLQYYNGTLLLVPAVFALRNLSHLLRLLIALACATFVLPPKWFLALRQTANTSYGSIRHAAQSTGPAAYAHLSVTQQWISCIPNLLAAATSCILVFAYIKRTRPQLHSIKP